jgi:putative DNA primase/helicase
MQKTRERAEGRWTVILSDILGEAVVSKNHGPCPMCGGKDRYRYDNKYGAGNWYCNVCGSGDGFELLQRTMQIDFAEAARIVDSKIGLSDPVPFKADIDVEKRRKALNWMWKFASAPDLKNEYLRERGLPASVIDLATGLRGHGGIYLFKNEGRAAGIYPAMLGLIRNKKGEPISIHRTYISLEKRLKKMMPPIEKITNGHIRLMPAGETLIVAEGIETALAAAAISGHPAWALMTAHSMESFCGVPATVKRLIICADNDVSFTGQKAAFALAYRYKNATAEGKKKIEVWMPQWTGDMLDVLQTHCATSSNFGILKWGV